MGVRTDRTVVWGAALTIYSVLLAMALLFPTSHAQSEGASWLTRIATAGGAPSALVTQARAEFVANALIVVPVSALGSLVWRRSRWRDWTAWAFAGACTIELAQGLFLPQRTASFVDVVANTLGALGGALAIAVLRGLGALAAADAREEKPSMTGRV